MSEIQNRFKSPVVWTAMAALIAVVFNSYGLWGFIGIDFAQFNEIIVAALAVGVAAGVLNDPTNPKGF